MSTYIINLTEKCNLNCKHCYALHNGRTISKEVLDKSIDHIINHIKISKSAGENISLMGREVGLINPSIINYALDRFENEISVPYRTELYTNLVYDLSEEQILTYKRIDCFGTSWDYGIRFQNIQQRLLWFNNVKKLLSLGFTDMACIVSVTKDLIENVSPQMMIDFMISMNIKNWELQKLCRPTEKRIDYDNKNIKATNREVDDWLFNVYLIYKNIQKNNYNISIEAFDCIENSIKGEYHYDHCRNCQQTHLTYLPNGDVAQCPYNQHRPFYNLITNKLDYKIYDDNVKFEQTVNQNCLNCPYYQYCRGDCCMNEWDETGCATPKKIYEYILNKKE